MKKLISMFLLSSLILSNGIVQGVPRKKFTPKQEFFGWVALTTIAPLGLHVADTFYNKKSFNNSENIIKNAGLLFGAVCMYTSYSKGLLEDDTNVTPLVFGSLCGAGLCAAFATALKWSHKTK